ncbi:MAG: hypothetical protein LBC75_02550 [Fibromonadaceae bacterium]|jgi:hypothetical protein|nr:hypothetical protein [Fibromonadaceae bacterium]
MKKQSNVQGKDRVGVDWFMLFGEPYMELREHGTIEEKVAVFNDLMDSGMKGQEPKHPLNKKNWELMLSELKERGMALGDIWEIKG